MAANGVEALADTADPGEQIDEVGPAACLLSRRCVSHGPHQADCCCSWLAFTGFPSLDLARAVTCHQSQVVNRETGANAKSSKFVDHITSVSFCDIVSLSVPDGKSFLR